MIFMSPGAFSHLVHLVFIEYDTFLLKYMSMLRTQNLFLDIKDGLHNII